MLACYFPTTVVFVDDNRKFLDNIRLTLNTKTASYKFFDNAISAANFLTKEYHADPFTHRCLLQSEDDEPGHRVLDVSIPSISQEIYNLKRFQQISVVVADYAMPGMNGAELSQLLQGTNFKIILLTGEANQSNAIELFNNGSIHYFIHKDDLRASENLKNAIARLQQEYFRTLSEVVIQSVTKKALFFNLEPSCLNDVIFKEFFQSLLQKHKITEYYLLDEMGSFLLVSEDAKLSWLLVQNEEEMQAAEFETREEQTIPESIRALIAQRKVMRHTFSMNEYPNPSTPTDWKRFIYPASKLEGQGTYYYSYIDNPLTTTAIHPDEIATFAQFRALI